MAGGVPVDPSGYVLTVTQRDHTDIVVLGAGSTGTNVAWYARDNGLRVSVVESALVGGECSFWACIPSKALLGPPKALADVDTWDNRDVTTTSEIPSRLVILGGGVVGCEMAQAHRRLGASEVTIIEMADRILSPYDPWVAELVAEAFDEDGIRVIVGRSAQRVTQEAGGGPVTVELDDGTTVVGDELLVATGRTANTDDIGLDAVGLEPGGAMEVDDQLRVPGFDWLHAAGDVNGRAMLTHQGKYQGRLIGDIVAGKDRSAWADHRAVPQVVFTGPEIASVGTTAQKAEEDGLAVRVVTSDLGGAAAAKLSGDAGRAQLVIDDERQVVIGATVVGADVGELIHAMTVAIVGEVPIDTLWHAVPAFPTLSEIWLRLLEADRDLIQ